MNRRVRAGHRLLALTAIAGLVGCASGGSAGPSQGIQTLYLPGSTISMAPGTEPFSKTIAVPIEQVWHYVPGAYDSLTIPLTTLRPTTHVVGNEGFKVTQRLGKERLSKFFDCGATQGGGMNADTFEMYVVLITQLEADGPSRTKIITTVQASGRPMQNMQDFSQCQSTGLIERRITDIITAHFAK